MKFCFHCCNEPQGLSSCERGKPRSYLPHLSFVFMYVHMRGWAGLVTKILGSPEEALNSNSKSIKRQAYLTKEVVTNSEKTKHCQNSPGVRCKTCVKLQLESFGYL